MGASSTAVARLHSVAAEVSREEDVALSALIPGAARFARLASRHWDFAAPARTLQSILSQAFGQASIQADGQSRLRRAAIARFALEWFDVRERLPQSVKKLYPAFLDSFANHLHDPGDDYRDDFFRKDVRYALGVSIPTAAMQMDVSYPVGPKLVYRDLLRTRSLSSTTAYLRARGWGWWYNNHLDLRYMDEFNPAGWTRCFALTAEILQENPKVRGIAGVSWFYDPQLGDVSPHVGYMRRTQVANGAFSFPVLTETFQVEQALVKSSHRRRLYEEGHYNPTTYLIVWPRAAVIEWAERLKTDPGLAFA